MDTYVRNVYPPPSLFHCRQLCYCGTLYGLEISRVLYTIFMFHALSTHSIKFHTITFRLFFFSRPKLSRSTWPYSSLLGLFVVRDDLICHFCHNVCVKFLERLLDNPATGTGTTFLLVLVPWWRNRISSSSFSRSYLLHFIAPAPILYLITT